MFFYREASFESQFLQDSETLPQNIEADLNYKFICYLLKQRSSVSSTNSMNSQGLAVETILKNFADSAAVNFHEFSKKCLATMNSIIAQQRKRREIRKSRLYDECSKKIEIERMMQISQAPKKSQVTLNQPEEQAESRIARINRIKETIQVRKNEQEGKQWSQQELDTVFQQFSKDLRPQILNKYPSAPADKVQKVILQKWNTIDPIKKDGYIAKILAKKGGQAPKDPQKQEQRPEREQMQEVKREEPTGQESIPEKVANRFVDYLSKVKNRQSNELEESATAELPLQQRPLKDEMKQTSDAALERVEEKEGQQLGLSAKEQLESRELTDSHQNLEQ